MEQRASVSDPLQEQLSPGRIQTADRGSMVCSRSPRAQARHFALDIYDY